MLATYNHCVSAIFDTSCQPSKLLPTFLMPEHPGFFCGSTGGERLDVLFPLAVACHFPLAFALKIFPPSEIGVDRSTVGWQRGCSCSGSS
jgi:hypothetical protein